MNNNYSIEKKYNQVLIEPANILYLFRKISMEVSSQDEYSQQKAIGEERLIEISPEQMHKYTVYRCIGALLSQDVLHLPIKATGFLIAPNLLLTAAHTVWNIKVKCWNKNIRFYLSLNGSTKDCLCFHPEIIDEVPTIYVPPEYKSGHKDSGRHDYAFVKLKQRVPPQKFVSLGINFKDASTELMVTGYPLHPNVDNYKCQLDEGRHQRARPYMQFGINKILEPEEGRFWEQKYLRHTLSTYGGQSGGPIAIKERESVETVVGIHVAGSKRLPHNLGAFVTIAMVWSLKIWGEQKGCDEFTVLDISRNCNYEMGHSVLQELKGIFLSEVAQNKEKFNNNQQFRLSKELVEEGGSQKQVESKQLVDDNGNKEAIDPPLKVHNYQFEWDIRQSHRQALQLDGKMIICNPRAGFWNKLFGDQTECLNTFQPLPSDKALSFQAQISQNPQSYRWQFGIIGKQDDKQSSPVVQSLYLTHTIVGDVMGYESTFSVLQNQSKKLCSQTYDSKKFPTELKLKMSIQLNSMFIAFENEDVDMTFKPRLPQGFQRLKAFPSIKISPGIKISISSCYTQ